jgi:hypothetical protein
VKDHYNAVRKSNLYEHCGISKALLAQIAGLIIGPPKEGEEADPDAGWCVATQDTLAAMLGCSSGEVIRQIAKFEADGWLTVKRFRNERGYPRCHYTITPEQLKKIQAQAMLKDEDGYYIRAKMPSKARKKKSHKNLNHGKKKPADRLSASLLTDSQQATQQVVSKPADKLSVSVVPSLVSSVDVSSRRSPEKPKTPSSASLRSPEPKQGKKENQHQNQEAAGNTSLPTDKPPVESPAAVPCPLKTEVAAKLRAAGCPDSVMNALAGYTKMLDILNGHTAGGCTNPVSAYVTFAKRNNKFADLWMPTPSGKTTGTDADFDLSNEDAEMLRAFAEIENAKPPEQRLLEAAKQWWYLCFEGDDGDARRHELLDFPVGYRTHWQVPDEQVVAAYEADMEKRQKREHEEVMKLDRAAKEREAKAALAAGAQT